MSSLAPLFESINSLALSFLYGPAVTSILAQGMEDKGKRLKNCHRREETKET